MVLFISQARAIRYLRHFAINLWTAGHSFIKNTAKEINSFPKGSAYRVGRIRNLINPMPTIKKYKMSLVSALVVILGIFFFFYRMYQNDMKALTDFSVSYQAFNTAIADFSMSKTADAESKAQNAWEKLDAKAHFQLSSLIKNDNVIPPLALQIASLSRQELEKLRLYEIAIQNKNANADTLAKIYADLTNQRKAAYTHFEELAELN